MAEREIYAFVDATLGGRYGHCYSDTLYQSLDEIEKAWKQRKQELEIEIEDLNPREMTRKAKAKLSKYSKDPQLVTLKELRQDWIEQSRISRKEYELGVAKRWTWIDKCNAMKVGQERYSSLSMVKELDTVIAARAELLATVPASEEEEEDEDEDF